MHRRFVLPLAAILAIPVWAQEPAAPVTDASESPAAESVEQAEESDSESIAGDDELDELDEQYSFEDEEETFIPSEDVAFGQSIPFPTDI